MDIDSKPRPDRNKWTVMRITAKHTLLLLVTLWLILVGIRFTRSFENALSWDVKGYYLYLPARFIYHDPMIRDTDWVESIKKEYNTSTSLYMLNPASHGGHAIKFTMGMSWLYTPMFFAGHAIAVISPRWPADGFSMPYQIALSLGMFIYVFLGMWMLRKILHHFFDATTVFFTLLIMVAGTNLLNQFALHGLLSHTPLFMLIACYLWAVKRFYELMANDNLRSEEGEGLVKRRSILSLPSGKTLRWFSIIAVLSGFITLIRPTEIVVVVVFLFWGSATWKACKNRLIFFLERPLWVLLFVALASLVVLPQLAYWNSHTGHWFYYSYENPGEGLDLLTPHTLQFLFSFRKGWLIYTPVMWFALYGLLILFRESKALFLAFILYLVAGLYLMSSWTTWWYAGGCFSSRTMISMYPVLAIPMGYTVKLLLGSRWFVKTFFASVIGFLIMLNVFQTWQFKNGIITLETMTREYYWRVFFRTSVTEEDRTYLLVRRSLGSTEEFPGGDRYVRQTLLAEAYLPEDFPDYKFQPKDTVAGSRMMTLDGNTPFSPVFRRAFFELTDSDHAWIRGRAVIYIPDGYEGPAPLLVMTFTHKGQNYKYRSSEHDGFFAAAGERNVITFDYLTPEVRHRSDELLVYVWHRSGQPIFLDSLYIEAFSPSR